MKTVNLILPSLFFALSLSGCATTTEGKSLQATSINQSKSSLEQPADYTQSDSSATQISRYVTIKNGPTSSQINPLLAVSTFNFPPSVYTVGEAVNQVLATTGYKLSNNLSSQAKQTLQQPLPITDRKLGPMKIQTALEILMGAEVYDLQRDPLHRLVSFEVKPSIAKALGVNTNE